MQSRLNKVTAKEPAVAAPTKEKMVDIPYESRKFGDVTVKGFRERLEAAYKTYDANNKKVLADTQAALKKYQDTLASLDPIADYDIKSLVAEVGKAREANQSVYDAIGQITMALGAMAQNYPDVDQTANSIIAEMMDELVGVGALNASNEALKTLTQYLEEYDEITVNFYRVIGGGKEKGERTREYFTYKKTKTTQTVKVGTAYKEAMLRLNNRLKVILSDASDAGAELVRFAKEVNEVMALWSLYIDNKTKKKVWGGKEVTNEDIERLLMGYDFYKEIGTDLSFRGTKEAPGVMETKLHAMLAKIKAKIESIVNAPDYAAGVLNERNSASIEFVEAATDGLKAITAEIYGAELAAKEDKGVVQKVKDFASGLMPTVPEPMMQGAAARQRILALRAKSEKETWKMTRDEYRKWGMDYALVGGKPADYETKKGRIPAYDKQHADIIKRALSEGKPVPAEVLADYPELKAAAKKVEAFGRSQEFTDISNKYHEKLRDRYKKDPELFQIIFELERQMWDAGVDAGYAARSLRKTAKVNADAKMSDKEKIETLRAALKDAEFLLRKVGINWKEAGSMSDSMKRSAEDAREALKATASKVNAALSLDGTSLKDSDVSYYQMRSDDKDFFDSLVGVGGWQELAEELVDLGLGKNPELIDWPETEKNAKMIVDNDFIFKPNEGIFRKDAASGKEDLAVEAKTLQEAFSAKKKYPDLYFDYDASEIVLKREAVNAYMVELGWRVVHTDDGDAYAILWY